MKRRSPINKGQRVGNLFSLILVGLAFLLPMLLLVGLATIARLDVRYEDRIKQIVNSSGLSERKDIWASFVEDLHNGDLAKSEIEILKAIALDIIEDNMGNPIGSVLYDPRPEENFLGACLHRGLLSDVELNRFLKHNFEVKAEAIRRESKYEPQLRHSIKLFCVSPPNSIADPPRFRLRSAKLLTKEGREVPISLRVFPIRDTSEVSGWDLAWIGDDYNVDVSIEDEYILDVCVELFREGELSHEADEIVGTTCLQMEVWFRNSIPAID